MRIKESLDKVVKTINDEYLHFTVAIAGRLADNATTFFALANQDSFRECNIVINPCVERFGIIPGMTLAELVQWGPIFLAAYGTNRLQKFTGLKYGNIALDVFTIGSFYCVYHNAQQIGMYLRDILV